MVYQRYDPESIKKALFNIDKELQVAFAASCAERIYLNYEKFSKETEWGDPAVLRETLNLIWKACEGPVITIEKIENAMEACEAVIPDSEDFISSFTSFAQDAAFAIYNILDFLKNGNFDILLCGARYPTDSLDLYVQEIEDMSTTDPKREYKILHHPLMQQELFREQRDLQAIIQSTSKLETINMLRERSSKENVFDK